MDTVVYALLNKKIRGLVSGIQSASVSGTTITFTMNDGSKQSITFPAPKDGLSITDVDVNADNGISNYVGNDNNGDIDNGLYPSKENKK